MGHVNSVRSVTEEISTGSRAIPHFGQEPGFSACTLGCIGQVKVVPGEETEVVAIGIGDLTEAGSALIYIVVGIRGGR
jgi:hypothetical protein